MMVATTPDDFRWPTLADAGDGPAPAGGNLESALHKILTEFGKGCTDYGAAAVMPVDRMLNPAGCQQCREGAVRAILRAMETHHRPPMETGGA